MSSKPDRVGRLRDLTAVIVGKSIAVGSLFLCGVLVARSSAVGEFGLYSTALALVLVLDATFGAPLDYAAVRFSAMHAEDEPRIARLQGAVFRLKLGISAILVAAALLWGREIAQLVLHDSTRQTLVWIVAGSTCCLLVARSIAAFLQAHRRFRDYAVLDFTQGAARLIAIGVLVFLGMNGAAYYLGAFAAALVAVLLLCAIYLRQPYLTAQWPNRADATSLGRYLGLIAGIVVIGTVTGRTDLLFLSAQRDAVEVGHYAAAVQLAGVLTLLAGYGGLFVQPTLTAALQKNQLSRLLLENVLVALALGALATAITYFLGGTALSLLFGESYREAHTLLMILVLGTSLDLLFMPVPMTFALQFKPRIAFAGEILFLLVFLAFAARLAEHGPVAMAWLMTGVRLAKAVFYLGVVGNHIRRPQSTASELKHPTAPGNTQGSISGRP